MSSSSSSKYSAGTADPALAMTYKLAVVMLALLNEPEADPS